MIGVTYTESVRKYKQSSKGQATSKAYRNRLDVKEKQNKKASQKYHDPITWRRYTLSSLKYRAKIRNYDFDLTLDDLNIPEFCPVFGIPLKINYGRKHLGSRDAPSVDRVDNNKGYTKDNIVIMSNRANILKKDGTLEEFEKLVTFLRKV